jgi:hypothetical protein
MNLSQPPIVATWLLQHFRSGRRNDSLTGDLIEEYRRGRSRAWYWRQVLMAIVISFSAEIWHHKLLTTRAVVAGWTSLLLLSGLVRLSPPLSKEDGELLSLVIPFGWWYYHWGYWGWLTLCLVSGGSGLMVARLHRTHQTAAVIAYAISWWLYYLPGFCRLVMDALGNPRYVPSLVSVLMFMLLIPISILLAGLWSVPGESDLLAPKSTSAIR